MLNTTLSDIKAECPDGMDEASANLRGTGDGWPFAARANLLRVLLAGISNCSIAHWYLMPGLNFHRYRVRLALSAIVGGRKELRNVVAQALDEEISPTAFLDFDFAWKAVASREPFGTYLDYSSPWLFPAMVLTEQRCQGAVVLGSDSLGMEVIERLAEGRRNDGGRTICQRINDNAFTSESFDVVTSLSWIARVADDIGTLKQLWSALKPGGMLLLSLPCITRAPESNPKGKTSSVFTRKPKMQLRRLYDESMLWERVFAVVGQPRRCVVYGESNPGADRNLATPGSNGDVDSLSNLLAIARGWQTYSDLRDIPGEGVIAMKFVKRSVH